MYFRLRTVPNADGGFVETHPDSSFVPFRLYGGAMLDADSAGDTHRFLLRHDDATPLRISDYFPNAHLMSKRLVAALRSAGASNLQTMAASLEDASGSTRDDYLIVNIVGLVACADLSLSESTPLAEGRFFFSLRVDEQRIGGLCVFRLAESLRDVIVDAHAARAIAAGGFTNLATERVA